MVVKKDTDYTAVYRDTTLELPAYLGGVVVLAVLAGAMAWSAAAKLGV